MKPISIQELLVARFKSDERGVTVIEYAIMLVLVAIAAIVANPNIQDGVSSLFSGVSSYLLAGAANLG